MPTYASTESSGRLTNATPLQVGSELAQLTHAVDLLEKATNLLIEKTAPIVYIPPQAGSTNKTEPAEVGLCSIAESIRAQRKRVTDFTITINERLSEFQV